MCPFVQTNRKNKYIIGIIDSLTKFSVIEAVRNTKAKCTVLRLEKFGAPARIITDRGTCFTSQMFKTFAEKHEIKHILNSSRHPQANGLIERLNGTILPALRARLIVRTSEAHSWHTVLPGLQRDLHTSISKSTGRSPFEAL